MASIQDIETRTQTLERKVEFLLKVITITRKEGIIEPKIVSRTLYDLYLAEMGAGMSAPLQSIPAPPPAPAEAPSVEA